MGDHVIELAGVGKKYRLGEHLGRATDLREAIAARVRRNRSATPPNEIWALQDIDLTVGAGESLGLVGRNGSGKSTLLKIIGGVVAPTVGHGRTRGKIGSLLEVGTGFHDELTGRENTYLSGSVLGMRQAEVTRQLDEIVEFAGVEGFIDTPVKRYSSGMYLRLAFAVAAHLDAQILLVDEVLAVGDAEFRRRCIGKMSEVESSGRTIIFVSHNLDALTSVCQRGLWLDRGRVKFAGSADDAVDAYLRSTSAATRAIELSDDGDEKPARVRSVAVVDAAGDPRSVVRTGDPLTVELIVEVVQASIDIDVGVVVELPNGAVLFDENLTDTNTALKKAGRHRVHLVIPAVLPPGEYSLSVWLGTQYEDIAHHERVLNVTVDGDDDGRPDRIVRLRAPWTAEWLDE